MNKKFLITLCAAGLAVTLAAQSTRFSLNTELGYLRSFKKEQRYGAVGHITYGNFHLNPKDAIYVLFGYFSEGKFTNHLEASAKSPATIPQQLDYENRVTMRYKQFSLGWKKYLKGGVEIEEGWSLYGLAGLGLMLGQVNNTHEPPVDTSLYDAPVYSGRAKFKRLTLDLGLGWEAPLGGDLYFYTEGKIWIPTTDYPSRHLFINADAPLSAILSAGIRILF